MLMPATLNEMCCMNAQLLSGPGCPGIKMYA